MSKKAKSGSIHIPALRCKLGDRGYLVASFRFGEVKGRIKTIPEVHTSVKLRDWIQRRLDEDHAKDIAEYLKSDDSRFFNAIVVGVYGGDRQWSALKVTDPRAELSQEDEARLGESIGILTLTGKEKLFPIDGQHRVAGIKRAVAEKEELEDDEVTVILIGHARTDQGMKRTRRLFVTLNQRAKRVSDRDILALDEDNGLAVVTRQMIDDYELFQADGLISFSGNVKIQDSDPDAVTSVLGLYQIVKALYPRKHKTWPRLTAIQRSRPHVDVLKQIFDYSTGYWQTLIDNIPEYQAVLVSKTKKCGAFRKPAKNHLLFRPVGQLAFARAVQYAMTQGKTMAEAVIQLRDAVTLSLADKVWHHILIHPTTKAILNNWSVAETLLLTRSGYQPRSSAAAKKLKDLQKLQSEGLV